MTEHQRETAFLRQIITFDDTDERHKLEQKMGEVHRDERCVKRIAWLMALLGGLGLAGLAYGTLFAETFPYGDSRLVFEILCILGLASVISLAVLACFLIGCRQKLNGLREECRRLVTKLLKSRLGKPHATEFESRPAQTDRLATEAGRISDSSGMEKGLLSP